MAAISHSLQANGEYHIIAVDTLIGTARKTEDGFYGQAIYGDRAEFPTMKQLKTWFEQLVTGFEGLGKRVQPAFYITVDEARKTGGLSHSQVVSRIKEIHRFHPYLRKEQYGAAILKEAFEAQASWPNMPGADYAARWLKENADRLPKMKKVDWDHWDRYREVRYL